MGFRDTIIAGIITALCGWILIEFIKYLVRTGREKLDAPDLPNDHDDSLPTAPTVPALIRVLLRALCGGVTILFAVFFVSVHFFWGFDPVEHLIGWSLIALAIAVVWWAFAGEPHISFDPTTPRQRLWIIFFRCVVLVAIFGWLGRAYYTDPEISKARQESYEASTQPA